MSALLATAAGGLLTAEQAGGEETGGDAGIFSGIAYPIIPHLGELIVGTICFLVILYLATRYAVPRLEAMLAERRSQIQGGIERAEQAQAEADAALAEYNAQLATARTEASRLREEARAEGAAILAEMRERAQAESARITEAAQRQVQAERQQAVTQLRTEVGGLATALASKIVGESLTDSARQSRVIDRFLAELEDADPDDVRAAVTAGAPAGGDADDEPGAVRSAVAGAKRLLSGLTGGDGSDGDGAAVGAGDAGGSAEPGPASTDAEPRTTGGATRGSVGPSRTSGGSSRSPREPGAGPRP